MANSRELSGVLSDYLKWRNTWDDLGSSNCDIQTLRIYHNNADQLKATCSHLSRNSSVIALDIGAAEGEGCNALAELLEVNQHIVNLRIQNLGTPESNVALLSAGLQLNPSIQQLTLQNLQPAAMVQLSQALSAQSCKCRPQQLMLPGARLDSAAAAALHTALLAQPQLTLLNLQSATFLAAAAHLINTALASHPGLARLELQRASGLDPAALGTYLASAAAAHSCALQAILLDECNLQDSGVQQMATAASAVPASLPIQQPPSASHKCSSNLGHPLDQPSASSRGLRELSLSNNGIGLEGARALGGLLGGAGFKQLAVLNLNQNSLGGEGLAELVKGWCAGGFCSLQELHLECNSIKGVEGLVLLLSSPAGRNMKTLTLNNNCISDEAVCQLAATISSSSSLTIQHMNLSSNWIKDEGAQGLAEMLKSQSTLLSLHLHKNRIGPKGIDALILAAFGNPGLQQMELSGNRFRDHRTKLDIEGLSRALAARRQGFGSSSRRVVAAAEADAAVLPGTAATADGSDRHCSGNSSRPCSSNRDKQGLNERRPLSEVGSEAKTAIVAAATVEHQPTGCAAKSAGHDKDTSIGTTAAATATAAAGTVGGTDAAVVVLEAEAVDSMSYDLVAAEHSLLSCSSGSAALGSSPFASQARCSSGWDDSPSGSVEAASDHSGEPQCVTPGSEAGNRDDVIMSEAIQAEEHSLAGGCQHKAIETISSGASSTDVTGFQLAWHRVTSGVGVLSDPAGGSDMCSSGGLQELFLPVGFVHKLKRKVSRSHSFDFWARTSSSHQSSIVSGSDMDSSAAGCSCTSTVGPLLTKGSLVFSGLSGMGPGNARLPVTDVLWPSIESSCSAEPLSTAATAAMPAVSLMFETGLGGTQNVDSLSGWMLDDAFTGQVVLAGLWNSSSSSMSGAGSLSGALSSIIAQKSSGEQVYSCSGDGATEGTIPGNLVGGMDLASSSSRAKAPVAAGAVRRLNSGGVLVKKASSTGASAGAALLTVDNTRAGLSRFGKAAAAGHE